MARQLSKDLKHRIIAAYALSHDKTAVGKEFELDRNTISKIVKENPEVLKVEMERLKAVQQDVQKQYVETIEREWLALATKCITLLHETIDSESFKKLPVEKRIGIVMGVFDNFKKPIMPFDSNAESTQDIPE